MYKGRHFLWPLRAVKLNKSSARVRGMHLQSINQSINQLPETVKIVILLALIFSQFCKNSLIERNLTVNRVILITAGARAALRNNFAAGRCQPNFAKSLLIDWHTKAWPWMGPLKNSAHSS